MDFMRLRIEKIMKKNVKCRKMINLNFIFF